MIRLRWIAIICLLFGCTVSRKASIVQVSRHSFNLSFDRLDDRHQPLGWELSPGALLDSVNRQDGPYSIRLEQSAPAGECGLFRFLPVPEDGDSVEVSGYVKNAMTGIVRLFVRIEGPDGSVIDSAEVIGGRGAGEWVKYSVRLPLSVYRAERIKVGFMFRGAGKVWVDGMGVTVDGESIEAVRCRLARSDSQARENLAKAASAGLSGVLTDGQVRRLTELGMLWGFLKYYHPAIGRGLYDWDSALFRILPVVLAAGNDSVAHVAEERWVDGLGAVAVCAGCRVPSAGSEVQAADYGYLFDKGWFSVSLQAKLAFIRDNHAAQPDHYYAGYSSGVGNPLLRHEDPYFYDGYPVAALRLLGLYRYWAIIQYLYPNRHLIGEDWNAVLGRFIPAVAGASDEGEYVRVCLALIGCIHDSHATIWNRHPVLDGMKGDRRLPFQAVYAEGKLVVTGGERLRAGTVVETIDGVPVDSLVRRYLVLTPGSNEGAQLRDLVSANGWLMRTAAARVRLRVDEGRGLREIEVETKPIGMGADALPSDKAYFLLHDDIGYIKPAFIHEHDLDSIEAVFAHTRGVVIDLRCYPSVYMPFSYGSWLKPARGPFAAVAKNDLLRPGRFVRGGPIYNGGGLGIAAEKWKSLGRGARCYKGKLVILADATTQSNAEYTVMSLQTVPGAVVIGSMTAGADGNVSKFYLPGNILTFISGIGVYYPDGGETQRCGVRIDVPMRVRIAAIREGRDELLDAAVHTILFASYGK